MHSATTLTCGKNASTLRLIHSGVEVEVDARVDEPLAVQQAPTILSVVGIQLW